MKKLFVLATLAAAVSLLTAAPLQARYLKIISPNGGELCQGAPCTITWEGVIPSPEKVRLILFQGGTKIGIIALNLTSTQQQNSYSWVVGKHTKGMASHGGNYRIVVRVEGGATKDASDSPITIKPRSTCK